MTISEPESNEEIFSCVKVAREKLEKVDADAKEKKTQIVKELAKDLEGKIPTDRIANEIVHQLHDKVSERLIHDCLDEKYKEKHRVENARKQKRKHRINEDLAAPLPLNDRQEKKKIVIDTSGNVVKPQTSIIKGTDYDSGKEIIAQSGARDVTNCEQCEIKDTRIRELEDVVIKTTQITPADQIAEDKDYKIKQLEQELDERTTELEEKISKCKTVR